MLKHPNNLIEYSGIDNCIPEDIQAVQEISLEETICIPEEKPNIEQVIKVFAESEIISTLVIKTPVATSLEGQKLTGWKLVVEGIIKQKIQYVADIPETPTQPVHAFHADVPFSSFIVLPEDFVIGTPIITTAFIEDIFAEKLDSRCIFKSITVLLTAEFC